jgi:acetylornithine deacetylase/succinyl-diaminopimelate desuccinylase-like protein
VSAGGCLAVPYLPAATRLAKDPWMGAAGADGVLARVRARVAERFPADLERIRDYLRLPSVSATGEGVRETAAATLGWVRDAGGDAELVETGGHPLLVGELPGPAGAPRLLRYGMYDVQPAEEPEWTSPPFAAEVRDLPGVGAAVVGRGSANSKGGLAAFFVAVEVLRELDALPVTVALLVEGEEELGSPHLAAAAAAHRGDLAADAAFDLDLTAGLDGRPELTLGCKGLLDLELACEGGEWGGPAADLHSSEQAWIASPAWALVRALASLSDAGERPSVPGLEGDPPGADDEALLAELAAGFDPGAHLRQARAARYRLDARDPAALLRALLFSPTVNVSGIQAGYTGPGGKTIVPSHARARVDVRLVPPVDPAAAAAAVRARLDAQGLPQVAARMVESYPWAKAAPGNRAARALRASYAALGLAPLPYPLAPWCAPYFVFDRVLGLEWAAGGAGHAAGAHGPDEYATLAGLEEHVVSAAAFLLAFAREPAAAAAGRPAAGLGAQQ